jgi:hypothetical protein
MEAVIVGGGIKVVLDVAEDLFNSVLVFSNPVGMGTAKAGGTPILIRI